MAYSLYQPTDSFLHRADPVTKIVTLAAWFVVAVAVPPAAHMIALAVLVVTVALGAGLGPSLTRYSRFVAVLVLMSALLWAVFSRDPATGQGLVSDLRRGAWVGLRLATMLGMGLILLASTRVEEMAAGLHRLGLPFAGAFSLTLAFRLLPLFTASGATIVQAQACRGLDIREGRLLARLKRYMPLLVPLVLSSLRASSGLAVALESRGLGMGRRRTSALAGRPGPWGAAVMALSWVVALAVVWVT